MSEPKDNDSFFRKVVRFVANPATDWADLSSRQDELREAELEKSELKAMIERKRRNDFVRKREFDMLRKVRREGLSPEQLAALGNASQPDDSEGRLPDSGAKQDVAVKAKIDEIEQQMVGDGGMGGAARRPPSAYDAPTQPLGLGPPQVGSQRAVAQLQEVVSQSQVGALGRAATAAGGASAAAPAGAPASPKPVLDTSSIDFTHAFSVDVSEVVHDPELDEAVIAFANADFDQCEQALTQITSSSGARAQHAETWLVRFDLYRAIGEQAKFESLALDYAQQFGWSAPQWFSMPRLVAESAGEETPSPGRFGNEVGWVCPDILDAEAVARLHSQSLQMPLPWVFDFSALKSIDAEAAAKFSELLRHWAGEDLEMRWLNGDCLFSVLADAAPTGVRDVDPAYWALRLDALRVANRADQFDEAAIDYCVTYEVSPPSWERSRCKVRISGSALSTQSPPLSVVSDVSTTFVESALVDDVGTKQVANVELSGQLVGDISATLTRIGAELGGAPMVDVSCAKLIRVDFIAAGDLLNWVLKQRDAKRIVTFVDAHRLVALFFGAMGINEHAKVKVRTV